MPSQPPPSIPSSSDRQCSADAWQIRSSQADQTMAIGAAVAHEAVGGDLIALIGELGSGKTQFVRGVARGMGICEADVCSPTFVVVHEYTGPPGRPVLVHVDAYRTSGASDLDSIGWDDSTNEHRGGAVVVVEWADRLAARLGEDLLEVRLDHLDQATRLITFLPAGSWLQRMPRLIAALERFRP